MTLDLTAWELDQALAGLDSLERIASALERIAGQTTQPATKFHAGQRVRLVKGAHLGLGTVLRVTPGNRVPYVVSVDDDPEPYSRNYGRCYDDSYLSANIS